MNDQFNELTYYTLGLQDECFVHQYIVDCFTAQTANKATISISLIFSLVGLYLHIEKKYSGKAIQKFHAVMGENKMNWPLINLPTYRGEITIEMVLKANGDEEKNKMIDIWSESIWNAYHEHHTTIIEILAYYKL